jgi:predicted transcriptional regulator
MSGKTITNSEGAGSAAALGFDYEAIPPEHRETLREDACRIRKRLVETAVGVMEIGERLHRSHELLPHGAWLPWLVAETGMSEQWSRNCIDVFLRFRNDAAIFAELDVALAPTAIVRLAGAPEAAYQEIVDRVRAGERIRVSDVEDAIRHHKGSDKPDAGTRFRPAGKKEVEAGRIAVYQLTQARPVVMELAGVAIDLGRELEKESPNLKRLRKMVVALKRNASSIQMAFANDITRKHLEDLKKSGQSPSTLTGWIPVEYVLPENVASVDQTVHMNHIICLEDGKKVEDLAAHLRALGTTPEAYRQKWRLPPEYPMQAPRRILQSGKLYEFDMDAGRLVPLAGTS